MKVAFIKSFLHEKQRLSHSVTFDYLIASIMGSDIGDMIETKVCFSYEDIAEYKPDVVCISTATESFMVAKELSKRIKDNLEAIVVMGGTHLTAVPQTLPESVDIGVLGEGEKTIIGVLRSLHPLTINLGIRHIPGICYRVNGELMITPAITHVPMDQLPMPVHADIKYVGKDATAILTTRGCVNVCTHCSEQKIWRPFRVLSPEKLVEIMEMHYKESGATKFVFLDDISFYNLNRVVRIRDILKDKGLLGKLIICKGSVNSELVTEPIVKTLKELGLNLAGFGLESASPRVLEQIKAGRVKVEDFINCMKLFGQYGIRNGASSVWGYPGETLDDMKRTREFLYEWNGRNLFFSFEQYVCQPLPGSDLWDWFLKAGKVSYDMDFSKIRIKPDFNDPDWFFCNEENMSKEEFAAFFMETSRGLRAIRKQGWKD